MTSITSIQKSSRPTCRLTGKAFWPLFGREVSVAMGAAGEVSLAHAQGCADQLLCPAPGVEEQLLAACVQAFRDAEECQGEPVSFLFEFEGMDQPQGLEDPRNILPYLRPVELSIDREETGSFSVAAFLDCAWEPELGMEWVVRDGRPLFAGYYTGLGSHCREEMYTSVWREQNYLFWAE